MKILFLTITLIYSISFSAQSIDDHQLVPEIIYTIDVNQKDDLFYVTVLTKNILPENNIYNFSATAPGTYEILDFGRFVKSFMAFDKNSNVLETKQISINQWKIDNTEKLAKVVYTIEDSYDSKIKDHLITPMSGTGIQKDFIVLNTFGVLGYFEKLQSNPVSVKFNYPTDWILGTAMDIDKNGFYHAETYDRLADSPVLLGKLTKARTKINNIDVEVFLYTPDISLLTADTILKYAEEVLLAAGKFINYSPVEYYKFLMVLLDYKTFDKLTKQPYYGALEHSYSSLYILVGTIENISGIKSTMAHEFMHILTPLNLHSEVIHRYNFAIPKASEHIWLYEGFTEWVSDKMQLTSGLITIEDYLSIISQKLRNNDEYSQKISLSQMSLDVYEKEVRDQFGNFYQRGAVVASLLDIRLLELSNGTRGLREVFLDLSETYGKNNPFPENEFFDIIVKMTYPEIEQFINDYIRGTEALPCKEYYAKLGIDYFPKKIFEDNRTSFGFSIATMNNKQFFVSKVEKEALTIGIQNRDKVIELLDIKVKSKTIDEIIDKKNSMEVGEPFDIIVKRNGEQIKMSSILRPRKEYHVFEINKEPSQEQKFLREMWARNL